VHDLYLQSAQLQWDFLVESVPQLAQDPVFIRKEGSLSAPAEHHAKFSIREPEVHASILRPPSVSQSLTLTSIEPAG
jgi:hypothetical protein